ncbi:AfsR/SARP family transcriptional regulator [Nocardia pseudovaccinii]|uniref:AfsR/SARP family transcriptional regulator n=1 Tax=Nocardia pseudovaccinii TaxID=189540 RepID=UPI003D8D14B3
MSRIEFRVLGPIRSVVDDVEATLPGRKLQAILAVLALRAGDEVRRDELIEELDLLASTGNASNTLHAHMTRLRRWLNSQSAGAASTMLESTPSGYRLGVSPSAVDAHRFLTQVEHAVTLGPAAPSSTVTVLEEALDLWHDHDLLGVLDGPLAAAAADELHRARRTARELLLDAWIALGHDHRVIGNAKRFIDDDPLNEQMRLQLITALRRVGRHTEAIEAYKLAEQVLRDELGVRPGSGLRTAFEYALGGPVLAREDFYESSLRASGF